MSLLNNKILFVHINKSGGGVITKNMAMNGPTSITGRHRRLDQMLFFSGNSEIDDSFTNWIKYIYSDKFDKSKTHSDVNIFKYCFSNQLNWLRDSSGNLIKVNKILRFENLKDELKTFLSDTLNLQKVDTSVVHPTNHNHYSEYYDEESKLLVEKHYKEDIGYFNYTF
jgi:hypothetical protein